MRWSWIALAALASVPALPAGAASAPAGCISPPAAASAALRHGLRPTAHVTLRGTTAVRAKGHFKSVLAGGVYFVSSRVGPNSVATWAFSAAAFKTGHGAVFSIDKNARRVSLLGSLVSPPVLAQWGVTTHTTGDESSRACTSK